MNQMIFKSKIYAWLKKNKPKINDASRILGPYFFLPLITGFFTSGMLSIYLRMNPKFLTYFKSSTPNPVCSILDVPKEIGNAEIVSWEISMSLDNPWESIFIYFDSDRILASDNIEIVKPNKKNVESERIIDENGEVVGVVLNLDKDNYEEILLRLVVKTYTDKVREGCKGFRFQFF